MADSLSDTKAKIMLDYALKYFEIHAGQRMSVFNFFIVLAGIVLTGLATCVVGDRAYAPIGIVLGILLAALALTFWKLDQRTSFLIKGAEKVLEHVETEHFPSVARIICNEPGEFRTQNARLRLHRKRWTYSRSLGLVFLVVGTLGIVGSALSGLRAIGTVNWFEKPTGTLDGSNVEIVETTADKAAQNATPQPHDSRQK